MGEEGIRSFRKGGYTIVDATRMSASDWIDFDEERLDAGVCQHSAEDPLVRDQRVYCDFKLLHLGNHADVLRLQDIMTPGETIGLGLAP